MFRPPRCPNLLCTNHSNPKQGFCTAHGSFRPKCRPHSVPRFRCRACKRTFSRQTFRSDYYDHRPFLNGQLFLLLASGVGLRQASRNLRLSRRCTELKARKIQRQCRRLNTNLRDSLGPQASLQLDELETFEGCRNTRPLSVPVLIEEKSRFIIWAESAPIRPRGKMTPARQLAIEKDRLRFGYRRDRSRAALQRTLRRGAALVQLSHEVLLRTDEKSTYPRLVREAFGEDRLVHLRTNSKLPRTTWNPLFPINHTEAMARDGMGRLRRDSWLASKKRRYLDLALQLHMAYRNYVRRRFNSDEASPAEILGFVPRRLRAQEVLSWRQDWGRRSTHPLATRSESIQARLRVRFSAA